LRARVPHPDTKGVTRMSQRRGSEKYARKRRVLMAAPVALLTAAFAVQSPVARATFPGSNGKIAFESDRTGNFEIFVMRHDGTGVTQVTHFSGSDEHPAWSPGGGKIALDRTPSGGNTDVYVMRADGTHARRLTTNPKEDYKPAWSPNGRRIAFTSLRSGH